MNYLKYRFFLRYLPPAVSEIMIRNRVMRLKTVIQHQSV